MNAQTYSRLAGTIFAVIAILHLVRAKPVLFTQPARLADFIRVLISGAIPQRVFSLGRSAIWNALELSGWMVEGADAVLSSRSRACRL